MGRYGWPVLVAIVGGTVALLALVVELCKNNAA